ncbi:hypothetical protein KEM54_003695 [Ascosphaera aggregata]|nr:hypothetical protein KEM54_003695 [Ascosphaera aggregata]
MSVSDQENDGDEDVPANPAESTSGSSPSSSGWSSSSSFRELQRKAKERVSGRNGVKSTQLKSFKENDGFQVKE